MGKFDVGVACIERVRQLQILLYRVLRACARTTAQHAEKRRQYRARRTSRRSQYSGRTQTEWHAA